MMQFLYAIQKNPKRNSKKNPKKTLKQIVSHFIHFLQKTKEDPLMKLKFALVKSNRCRSNIEKLLIEQQLQTLDYFKRYIQRFYWNFYQGFTKYQEVCERLYSKNFHSTDTVISQGQVVEQFYVLLQGTVTVYNYEPKNSDARIQLKVILNVLNQKQQEINKKYIPQFAVENLFTAIEIRELKPGCGLGQMGLLQNIGATATIKAKTSCTFVCLTKSDFLNYSPSEDFNLLEKKIEQIFQIPFLHNQSYGDIRSLSHSFQYIKYRKSHYIFNDGQEVKGLFMICDGEVKIMKNLKQNQSEANSSVPLMKEIQEVNKFFSVCLLQSPSILYDDKIKYIFSAVCESQYAELLFISKTDLENHMNRNELSQIDLRKLIKTHDGWRGRQERITRDTLQQVNVKVSNNYDKPEQQLKQYLKLPEEQQQVKQIHLPNLNKKRVSLNNDKFVKLDFVQAKEILDQTTVDEKDFKSRQINTMKSTSPLFKIIDIQERAKKLGLGAVCKTFRDKNRRRKKEQEIFNKYLEKIHKSIRNPDSPIKQLSIEALTDEKFNKVSSEETMTPQPTIGVSNNWFKMQPISPKITRIQSYQSEDNDRCCINQSKQFRVFLNTRTIKSTTQTLIIPTTQYTRQSLRLDSKCLTLF